MKQPPKFDKVKAVKAAARELAGPPPPTRRIPDKRKARQEFEEHQRTNVRELWGLLED
jgi:DNA polymerase III delta prime subunit